MNEMYNTTQRHVNETQGLTGGVSQTCGRPVGAAYISALQFTVTTVGIVVNLCMLVRIFQKRQSRGLSKYTNDVDVRFVIIGLCDICTLVVFPLWIMQSTLLYGWVLGSVMCSALKGVTTVSVGHTRFSSVTQYHHSRLTHCPCVCFLYFSYSFVSSTGYAQWC